MNHSIIAPIDNEAQRFTYQIPDKSGGLFEIQLSFSYGLIMPTLPD
jgi:hypothetical protein